MNKTIATLLLTGLLASGAWAQDQDREKAEPQLPKPDVIGPSKVNLGDHLATLDLPKGFAFFNKESTRKIMMANGNPADENDIGLVLGIDGAHSCTVLIGYEDTGHVKDDEKIDADKLLESLKEGTEAQNEERKKMNAGAVHVTGWLEAPHYEAATHHVIWVPQGQAEEPDGSTHDVVNYNTRILGRTGVLSLNLLTSAESLPETKPNAEKLLAATHFDDGKKYEDYKSGDKTAEYGLMGLILGGSLVLAKKAGLLGLLALGLKKLGFLLVFVKKFFVFIIAGIAGAFRKLGQMFTGRRSDSSAHQVTSPPPPAPDPPPPPELPPSGE